MIETAQAFGIDIGGSGIKGAPVDLATGAFAAERLRIPTPQPATPDTVASAVKEILDRFGVADGTPIGIAFPAPVKPGKPLGYMANLDQTWVGVDVYTYLSERCGRIVHVVNDADAAGLAEAAFGAAKGVRGLVVTTTLGTGIGTALVNDGTLIPNCEMGHLIIEGKGEAERYCADSVRSSEALSWKKWGKRLNRYYKLLEFYLSPDIFVVGGGVSKKHERFFPYIDVDAPIVPATLLNAAGIVGAAQFAAMQ